MTDPGEPIAEIAARRRPRWVPGGEVDAVLRELDADELRAQEIATERSAVDVAGPWERVE